jgi:hypothetical protein
VCTYQPVGIPDSEGGGGASDGKRLANSRPLDAKRLASIVIAPDKPPRAPRFRCLEYRNLGAVFIFLGPEKVVD